MTKISSARTGYYKRGFPLMWFGFLAFFIVGTVATGVAGKDLFFLLIPCIMAVAGFFMMRKFVWDLADHVEDGGSFLLVRNKGKEQRIDLSNIMNVSASTNMNPPRITLRLVEPGIFGNEISFSPASAFSLNPFAKNKIVEDLIVRVYQAKPHRTI